MTCQAGLHTGTQTVINVDHATVVVLLQMPFDDFLQLKRFVQLCIQTL